MKISLIVPTRAGIPQGLKNNISLQSLKPDEIIEVIGEGLTVQRNEGVKKATGDIIIFMDDDIRFDIHFIFWLINTFIWYPDAKAVSANPQIKSYTWNILWDIYARVFMLTWRGMGIYQESGFPTNYHPKIDTIIQSEVLHGCCMAIRKEVFNTRKFNENLVNRMYGEDDYFSNEIMKECRIYYNPYAVCRDTRPYRRGNQSQKIRSTIINLILRHKMKERSIGELLCFVWAMIGFTVFKIVEAILMRDMSIIQGLLLCFITYEDKPVEEIRKNIRINIYDNQWRKVYV